MKLARKTAKTKILSFESGQDLIQNLFQINRMARELNFASYSDEKEKKYVDAFSEVAGTTFRYEGGVNGRILRVKETAMYILAKDLVGEYYAKRFASKTITHILRSGNKEAIGAAIKVLDHANRILQKNIKKNKNLQILLRKRL
jgi:hypothetical protein